MNVDGLLKDKRIIIFGVANKKSIAWALAQRFHEAGARLVLTYQDERLADKVNPLAESLGNVPTVQCDLTVDEDIEKTFEFVRKELGGLDTLVHSVAYAPREDLEGRYIETSAEGFQAAHQISSYTLTAASRGAFPLLKEAGGGTILAMTYLGSERVIPHYNVMGVAKASLEANIRYLAADLGEDNIRVNGLSPGPLNTLSARGISGFTTMLKYARERAPMKKNTDPEEVADTALFLASDLGRGITGEVIYIDGGYHVVGM